MKPFLLVNAGSGGGTSQHAIVACARDRGIDHHVVEPGEDFGPVLQDAVDGGADLLAAAGGDGTLCAVADMAMSAELPMLVVPAGTRNHFALDLGLDLTDPVGVLEQSLDHDYERRVDVGSVNGSTFLNNVSLGIYAVAVSQPEYRERKLSTLASAAVGALRPSQGRTARLTAPVPVTGIAPGEDTGAIMIVNNAYAATFAAGDRLRPRLDSGQIWVYVGGAGVEEEANLLSRAWQVARSAVTQSMLAAAFGTDELVVESDVADIPIAVDGEHRPDLTAPLHLRSRAGALRLRVPEDPGTRTLSISLVW